MTDTLILMIIALVVFGPRRLPQIGRQIGKLMYEFRKASNDFKFQMEEELRAAEEAERKKKEEAERAQALALPSAAATTPRVEAQAAIGADDQASVSAQPPVAPAATSASESGYPSEYPVETPAAAAEEQQIRYPRINPPSIGEQVAAARPGAAVSTEAPAGASVTAEANAGSEPAAAANGTGGVPKEPAPAAEVTPTETVTQHG